MHGSSDPDGYPHQHGVQGRNPRDPGDPGDLRVVSNRSGNLRITAIRSRRMQVE
jgi:hypothetical protein